MCIYIYIYIYTYTHMYICTADRARLNRAKDKLRDVKHRNRA